MANSKIWVEARYNREEQGDIYTFDTPTEFIKKWYELDEGIWYRVLVDGKEICEGAVDPDDIEIFESYFNMKFQEELNYEFD